MSVRLETNLNDYLKNYSPYMLHTGINILFAEVLQCSAARLHHNFGCAT